MSYAESEFPHTSYYDYDNRELIRLYIKLTDEYEVTMNEIKSVSARLDKYEADMDSRISDLENNAIPKVVDLAVKNAMYNYQVDVNNRLNALNNRVSTVESMYASLQGQISDEVNGLRTDLNNLREDVIRNNNNLTNQINQLSNKINQISDEMHQMNSEITSYINISMNNMDGIMKLRDAQVLSDSKEYTDTKVSALYTLIEGLDLASNKKEIRWVWQYGCCFGGYNAIQWYNETPITCDWWNKSNITCEDWYVRSREIFGWFKRRQYMFSPISGKYVDVRQALMELASALKINGLTAEEYEKLGFTAEEYDAFNETAIDYDWNGRRLLGNV